MDQTDRKRAMNRSCTAEDISNNKNNKIQDLHKLLVSLQHKLNFCHVPKVGSTPLHDLFKYQLDAKLAQKLTEKDLASALDSHTSIIFVRHPLHRLYSAYNDKVVGQNWYYVKIVGEWVTQVLRGGMRDEYSYCYDDITFEDFIKMVIMQIKEDINYVDVHWMPYYALCKPCHINYNYIGQIETLDSDIENLEQTLTNVGLDKKNVKKKFENQYVVEKCRQMKIVDSQIKLYKNYTCDIYSVILKSKLQALWNKGFVPAFGFTLSAFKKLHHTKWKNKCEELVQKTMSDPYRRKQVHELSRLQTEVAVKGLSSNTLSHLISLFKLDFEMFGYDLHPFEIS